jgi:hypothetical protein
MKKLSLLKIVLRILSILLMFGFVGVILPHETMARLHHQLGLGNMPEGPIVSYLARSVSLFYAFHGVILYYLSGKPEKYLGFLTFYLWASYPFGIALLFIDIHAGMPSYWTYSEGPMLFVLITFLLMLVRRQKRADSLFRQ